MKIMPHEIRVAKQDHDKPRTIIDVARRHGISANCLRSRLWRNPHLTIEEAASIPLARRNCKAEPPAPELTEKQKRLARLRKLAERNGVPWKRAWKRLWHGWDEHEACTAPYVDHEERGRRGGTKSFSLYGEVAAGHRSAFFHSVKNHPSTSIGRRGSEELSQ